MCGQDTTTAVSIEGESKKASPGAVRSASCRLCRGEEFRRGVTGWREGALEKGYKLTETRVKKKRKETKRKEQNELCGLCSIVESGNTDGPVSEVDTEAFGG